MTYDEKYTEISERVENTGLDFSYCVLVQFFCIEAWFLANKEIMPARPNNRNLIKYGSSAKTVG